MGNTCAACVGTSSSAQEQLADAGRQRAARTAVVDDSTVETIILLGSESVVAADKEEQSPRRRSKGRKGTGFVRKGDLDEEQLREVQMQLPDDEEATPEGGDGGAPEVPAAAPRKKGGRKATGFVFQDKLQELSGDESEGEQGVDDGTKSDAEEEGRKRVLINEGVNETFWLKDKEDNDEEERCWRRTSERKATGKAIQLTPEELDEIHQQVHFEPEQEDEPRTAADAPVLLAAPAPKRRGRKPTGRPTQQQVEEAIRRQEGDEVQSPREASPSSPPPRRQKVRRDTGHPTADSKRTRAKRALGRLFRM